jgi:hypothetical protein
MTREVHELADEFASIMFVSIVIEGSLPRGKRKYETISTARGTDCFVFSLLPLILQTTFICSAAPSAARKGEPERGHLLAVANQEEITGQHRVVPGLALDRLEAGDLRELIGCRLNQRQFALLR